MQAIITYSKIESSEAKAKALEIEGRFNKCNPDVLVYQVGQLEIQLKNRKKQKK